MQAKKQVISINNEFDSLDKVQTELSHEQNEISQHIQPIILNFQEIRKERQISNYNKVFTAIKNKNKKELRLSCNEDALERLHEYTGITIDSLMQHNYDDMLLKTIAFGTSKTSSRQGCKDESLQITTCNETASKVGVFIDILGKDDVRPCKDGRIILKKDFKNMSKNSCLKSFDAKISGKIDGYVFAKVVLGNGGHQDNVFEEAFIFGEWARRFGSEEMLYVILIDTDLMAKFKELKKHFNNIDNILVVNHIEFQQWVLDAFSDN